MKTSTSDLRTLLHGATSAFFADLVTVTLADATVARWTTDPYDLVWGGNTYTAGGTSTAPVITRGRIRETTGLEVATMELTLGCGPASGASIGGIDLRVLAQRGGLDDAQVMVHRAYMATAGGTVVGAVSRFQGVITDCEADSHEVRARVQSDLYRLNEQLPRHMIREKCSWALFDAGCGLSVGSFTFSSTVNGTSPAPAGSTIITISTTDTRATGYYDGGRIVMTSGALAGQSRAVVGSVQSGTEMAFRVQAFASGAPQAGDTLNAFPGCDKTIATCDVKFSNLTRRRGFDFVPAPDYVTR